MNDGWSNKYKLKSNENESMKVNKRNTHSNLSNDYLKLEAY